MTAFTTSLSAVFFVSFSAIAFFYAIGTKYDYSDTSMVARYGLIQDVHVMIFVGFAFLMSFLHNSGLTAVSHATLIAVIALLWGVLMRGFWAQALLSDHFDLIRINLNSILNGDFVAGACLISFGAVIGRVSAAQMIIMVLVEGALYAINEVIIMRILKIADVGGAIYIHEFGCYFGLALSWMIGRYHNHKKQDRSNNKATRMTDTYAMIGTLFLFCFWPSFTSVGAGMNDPGTQQRAFVNTFLGMCGAAFAAFGVMQVVYGGKFRMVEVQNSTLAAGVAFGVLADMNMSPFGAVFIGASCGTLSVVGYSYIQSFLERRYDLLDTCGINNLHGMPAIFGGLISYVLASNADQASYNNKLSEVFPFRVNATSNGLIARTASQQANYQLVGVAVTFAIAIAGGLATGWLISLTPPLKVFYDDAEEFEVEEEVEEHAKETSQIVANKESAPQPEDDEEMDDKKKKDKKKKKSATPVVVVVPNTNHADQDEEEPGKSE